MKPQPPYPLRRILRGKALFCALGGMVCMLVSNPISTFLGVQAGPFILAFGISFLGYAGLVYYQASHPVISRPFVFFAICVDSAWVLGSILLLLTDWPPFALSGKWTVGLLAVVVDLFATLQFMEWRKM